MPYWPKLGESGKPPYVALFECSGSDESPASGSERPDLPDVLAPPEDTQGRGRWRWACSCGAHGSWQRDRERILAALLHHRGLHAERDLVPLGQALHPAAVLP